MRKSLRAIGRISLVTLVVAALVFGLANLVVFIKGRGLKTEARAIKPAAAAIVFGAMVYDDGTVSPMLADRVDAGIDLYRQGKVRKLLMTGDHGRIGYDEVNAMRRRAIEAGVAESDIFTDHAGFSTYESLYRARDVFRVKRAVLVTQRFHLRRALYIARSLGLRVEGLAADKRAYFSGTAYAVRELFANLKAVGQVTVGAKPTFLGPAIPITGDGRKSKG